MKKLISLIPIILLFASISLSYGQNSNILPNSLQKHWEKMAEGIWVAENPYKGDQAPYDAYVLDFHIGEGGMVFIGRMYGTVGGKEVKTLWNFLRYWNPKKQKEISVQYADNPLFGNIAIGESLPSDEGEDKSYSEAFKSDGTSLKIGHKNKIKGDKLYSRSFNIENGEWKDRGVFVWKLQKRDKS